MDDNVNFARQNIIPPLTCHLLTWWMHRATNRKPATSAAQEMQPRPILKAKIPDQIPLREEIRGQLHRASTRRANHCRSTSPVQTPHALAGMDLSEAIDCAFVIVLCADWEEGGECLQARFHKEEW